MTSVLVLGYGSIGKRHVANLLSMGVKPFVLTIYPDGTDVYFLDKLSEIPHKINYAIIASPTVRHLADFEAVCKRGCRRVLIEKPVEMNINRAELIRQISVKYEVATYCAYNLRFMKVFQRIKQVVELHRPDIRLVKIVSGQYLPEWRPYKDYRESYSAHRDQGGGVDLDISHEIDYMSWIFGIPVKVESTTKGNISKLSIDSPDYFHGMYRYSDFLVYVELDYIRPKERTLRIIGENRNILDVDLINQRIEVDDIAEDGEGYFDIDESYKKELAEFLENKTNGNLATLDESIESLRLLGVL